MNPRDNEIEDGVGRRKFMLGASALGAAALAAWIGGAEAAEADARPVDESLRAWRRRRKTVRFTIHSDATMITPVDIGQAGASVGDLTYFQANLRLRPGGEIVGQLLGTTSMVVLGTPNDAQLGPRITHLVFASSDLRDQIVVTGVADYPVNGVEFQVEEPVIRAIVGGTGLFVGVRGELTTTRLGAGVYQQDFTLLT